MLQARQLGKELYAGVHSDEDILLNKGPVVMKMDERMTAVTACKWLTEAIGNAPYVTDPDFIGKYGCEYVVHGDDITTDANGEDCYQGVKDLGMFVVVKRTPNISTTDLVGRMLLMSKNHHFQPIRDLENVKSHALFATEDALLRFEKYASDGSGLAAGSGVYTYVDGQGSKTIVEPSAETLKKLARGVFYVDGGFDLFHPGHIEALKKVHEIASAEGGAVVVGLHDDKCINTVKGLNYPIMNVFERSLCVLQCRYVDALVVGAAYVPSSQLLESLPGPVKAVFHGPTPVEEDVYKSTGRLFQEIGPHKYDDMNTAMIVDRVLSNKKAYEERQKRKGWKAEVEAKLRAAEVEKLSKPAN